jgi:pimeloyl-ACP methyl ester carboxylesterase
VEAAVLGNLCEIPLEVIDERIPGAPVIGQSIGVVSLDIARYLRIEEQRPIRNQKPDAQLDRVDRGQQVQVGQEVENGSGITAISQRREGHPRSSHMDACLSHDNCGLGHVGDGVALVEDLQDVVVGRLESGHDEHHIPPRYLGPKVTMVEDVLNLHREVERQTGKSHACFPQDVHGVSRGVEEVGIAERDVTGPQSDQGFDVGQDTVQPGDPVAPVVDSRNRTMPAAVAASMAGLDVACQPGLTLDFQAGVVLEPRKQVPGGWREGLAADINPDRPDLDLPGIAQAPHPGRQLVFVLAHYQAVGQSSHRSIGSNRCIETVEGDGEIGSAESQASGGLHGQAHGGVHGNRERHRPGGLKPRFVPLLYREVQTRHIVALCDQPCRGRGEVQRLVPEFVGGDEENTHWNRCYGVGEVTRSGSAEPTQTPGSITVFGVSGSFQVFPSGTLYVHDYGGDGAPPIVAIHGLGGAHLNWMPPAPGLIRSGHLIAPDLPGFGYTPPRGSYSISSHAQAIVELLEGLRRPAVLMGNSLGALVAIHIAAEFPDLVEGMVLVAPAAPPRWDDDRIDRVVAKRLLVQGIPAIGPAAISRYWKATTPASQMRDTLAVVCAHPDRIPQSLVEPSLRLAAARRRQPWALDALVKSGRSAGAMIARRSRMARTVSRVSAPTLVIQGTRDRVIPASAIEWLARVRPDWDHVAMDDCGHCPQIEAPSEFVSIYDAWAATTRTKAVPTVAS